MAELTPPAASNASGHSIPKNTKSIAPVTNTPPVMNQDTSTSSPIKSINDLIMDSIGDLINEDLKRFKNKLLEQEECKFAKSDVDQYKSIDLADHMIRCCGDKIATQQTIMILKAIDQMDIAKTLAEKIQHVPGKIKIDSMTENSVSLSWDKPAVMETDKFKITYGKNHETTISENKIDIPDLNPEEEYTVKVATVLENGTHSVYVSITFCTTMNKTIKELITSSLNNLDKKKFIKFKIKLMEDGKSRLIKSKVDAYELNDLVYHMISNYGEKDAALKTVEILEAIYQRKPAGELKEKIQYVPGKIKIDSKKIDFVSLSWDKPAGMDMSNQGFKVVYSCSGKHNYTSASENRIKIPNMNPGGKFIVKVATKLQNGTQSAPVSTTVHTELPPPGKIKIDSMKSDSVSLSWGKPDGMDKIPHSFKIAYISSDKSHKVSTTAESNSMDITKLRPGRVYTFTVSTVRNGSESKPVSKKGCTKLSPPGEIKIDSMKSDSVFLSWGEPDGMEQIPHRFNIIYVSSDNRHQDSTTATSTSKDITKLRPGTEYNFTVTTVLENDYQSIPVSKNARTSASNSTDKPNVPTHKTKNEKSSQEPDVHLQELIRANSSQTASTIKLSEAVDRQTEALEQQTRALETMSANISSGHEHIAAEITAINSTLTRALEVITSRVSTAAGRKSRRKKSNAPLETHLKDLLYKLGLENYYPSKIKLSTVLEIGTESITDEPIQSLHKLPWCFLKRLMMVNVTARNTKCSASETETDTTAQDLDSVFELMGDNDNDAKDSNQINPLDIITALFLCSDSFLQQEIMLQMSMCQFAVPLLLPNCVTNQCTLMLWAMQDIVKKFRPLSLANSKGFVEDSIVSTAMPVISFVRLSDCSLSKSQILNQVLSNPQQYHDFFIHCNMECGDVTRRISNGLVEIGWYLPSGKPGLDVFLEPVAVVNLHGDISSFQTQFSILGATSSAVFIVFDSIAESEYDFLSSIRNIKAQLFLVVNCRKKTEKNVNSPKDLASKLKLNGKHIIFKNKQINDADFVNKLRLTMNDIIVNSPQSMTVEDMSAVAHELGINVDEDCDECQNAKESAKEITSNINDVGQYKEEQLPLQGKPWKELAKIEKEECRLQKAGDKPIEAYKNDLQKEKQKLRQEQIRYNISEAMQCFITAISNSNKKERSYFLRYMRMNLDVAARAQLSGLRDQYKEKCSKLSKNKQIIADLDQQISNCSLGVEHFMREMGQLYEASCHLPSSDPSHDQFQHLPGLAADLLMDGFPLELVDGDASNIPIRWVTDVLTELHEKVQHKSRLLVVTVLGVQSTGKSTLLNTMFGVQFAVNSGRCTRGAFMLLLRVKEDLKEELKCDFILVIDTEGLKAPELAQLDDNYEHDNELATLVVGLSDITIINIAMENSTEMKDILQIVVHAFLRMDKVGKKPKCYFLHQNVGDVSAHDNNMRDRKMLLEQLNEMTEAAARMEKQDINRKFTDIMEYDPEKNNWYIPGLWHGNPPMAPVNSGYSEAVYEFKKSLIEVLKSCNDQKPPAQIKEFLEWVESLWKAVKYENFIFSFRNSLVAEAYSNLCVEYNDWEWAFKKHMYNWLTNVETRISNTNSQSKLDLFLKDLKDEASGELIAQEKIALDKFTEYYERKDGRVNFVESYRAFFEKSINTFKIEIENSLTRKCKAAIDFQKGKLKVRDINLKHKSELEKKVLQVLEGCRESNVGLSDEELTEEFEKMWKETVAELNFIGLQKRDIGSNVLNQLRKQLGRHVGAVTKVLNETSGLTKYGTTEFKVTSTHLHRAFFEQITKTNHIEEANKMAQSIIAQSKQFVASKNNRITDYHETYTGELLEMIDQKLKDIEKPKTNAQFEVDLKLHICGFAAKAFQQMHENFIEDNDPLKHLEKSRPDYCSDFIDLYHEKDQCKKKAKKFTQRCLEPAVRDYVIKTLGIDIADEMLTGAHSLKYSTRTTFQHSLLKQMLNEKDFRKYVDYISDYETFVKNWIFDCILEQFSKDQILSEFEVKRLETITKKIQKAIEEEKKKETSRNGSETISVFIENVCSTLNSAIMISTDNLGFQVIKDKANTEEFIGHLEDYVYKMKTSLSSEFSQVCDINKKLNSLPFKPQDELFKRVFGCGKQCPFCKVPCEAGGKNHKEHHASVHRPQGLGTYRYVTNKKLTETICTSDVFSENTFQNSDTEWKPHPYKDYRRFYPDWNIAPDPSIKASDYWKYVLTTFNNVFAKEYNAEPADVPEEWKNITDEQALTSLNEVFNIKT